MDQKLVLVKGDENEKTVKSVSNDVLGFQVL
jgi:hypothetical protein